MSINDRTDIQIHGKFYKKFTPPEGEKYDGLALVDSDCQRIVKRFYDEKKSNPQKKTLVNVKHGTDFLDYVGDVTDIYYDKDAQKLGTFLRIDKKAKNYDSVEKMLKSGNGVPPGLSHEIIFEYENAGEGGVQTADTRVKDKILSAISIVDVPDHHKDGTFITGWVMSDDPSDLYMVQDKTFDNFLSDVEKSDKYSDFMDSYKKYSKKTYSPKSINSKADTITKKLDDVPSSEKKEDVYATKEENGDQKPQTKNTDAIDTKSDNLSDIDREKKSLGESQPPLLPKVEQMSTNPLPPLPSSPEDKKESSQIKSEQSSSQITMDRKQLDDLIASAVSNHIKSIGGSSTTKKKQVGKQTVKKEEPKDSEMETENAEETETFENQSEENGENEDGMEENHDNNDFESQDQPSESDSKFARKRTQSKEAGNDDRDIKNSQKRRKTETGMSFNEEGNGQHSIVSALKNRTETLEKLSKLKNDPKASKQYFMEREKEQTEDLLKLAESLKDYYGGEMIPEGVKETLEKSFADGTYKENQLVQVGLAGLLAKTANAGLRTYQSSLSHREADYAYQESKRREGNLTPRQSYITPARNNMSNRSNLTYGQSSRVSDNNSFDKMFSTFSDQNKNVRFEEDDMDVDTEEPRVSKKQEMNNGHQQPKQRIQKSSPGMGIQAQSRKSVPISREQEEKNERERMDSYLYKEYSRNTNPVPTIAFGEGEVNDIETLSRRTELSKGFSSLTGQKDYVRDIIGDSESLEELRRNVSRGVVTDEGRAGLLSKVVFDVYTENLIRNNEPGKFDAMHKYGGLNSAGTTIFSY